MKYRFENGKSIDGFIQVIKWMDNWPDMKSYRIALCIQQMPKLKRRIHGENQSKYISVFF